MIVPFREKESVWVERADLITGRLPPFLFGFPLRHTLPVFRFSRVTRTLLEPYLVYLMQNGYRTIGTAEMMSVLSGEREVDPKEVMLTFDHGWASGWTVAAPLLRRYGFRATAYVIPGRVLDLDHCRPVMGEPGHDPDVDRSQYPYISWTELKQLCQSGPFEIQSNGWSHAKVFSHDKFLRLVEPETRMPVLSWPMISDPGEPLHFLSSSHVFHPLLPTRSRLSDAIRHDVDPSVVRRIHDDPDAAPYLFKQHFLQMETAEERETAIREEFILSREALEDRLDIRVRHFAFPWGVSGSIAQKQIAECGYESAFSERRSRLQSVRQGHNPYRLGRLPHQYIRALPGRRRKKYWRITRDSL
jgi:peptidoglycan/xylan/chitin deacetylase (PgdA/CDA1 family)